MTQQNRNKLFGTWKNRLTVSESTELAVSISALVNNKSLPFELSFCPPMVALDAVNKVLMETNIALTSQNLIWEDSVSFTGETSARALSELHCKYVIIGHSERRIYLGEDDVIVAKKVYAAIKSGLIPVVAVGEFYDDYINGKSESVVSTQMAAVIESIRKFDHTPQFVIAYEPAWAISTSKQALTCKPEEANLRHQQIRQVIKNEFGENLAEQTSIIYGGSAKAENAHDYFGQSDIDGGLVGTASQTSAGFQALILASIEVFNKKTN